MKHFVTLLFGLAFSLGVFAQTSVQKAVEAWDSKEPLRGSVWGLCVKDLQGNILVQHDAARRMAPYSNRKLVTTGV